MRPATDGTDKARKAARPRGARLADAEIDEAADAEEVATGATAGVRAVYRRLGRRGSLSTINAFLTARRRKREAAEALINGDGQEGDSPLVSASTEHNEVVDGDIGSGGDSAQVVAKLLFKVSLLERAIRDQGKRLNAFAERIDLVEISRPLPEIDEAAEDASMDGPGRSPRDGDDSCPPPKLMRYRSTLLNREETDRLHAEIIRVLIASRGALGKHELYNRIHKAWQAKVDKEKVYEFAKARGRMGRTIIFKKGTFTLGPDAREFVRASKSNDGTNNVRTLVRDRKIAAHRFTSKAIEHLRKNPGKRYSDKELFEIVSREIGEGKLDHKIIDAKTLYRSLYNKFYREERKIAAGEILPKGRTLLYSNDRTFTKA